MTPTRVRPLNFSANLPINHAVNLPINHPITQLNYPITRLPDYPIQVSPCLS